MRTRATVYTGVVTVLKGHVMNGRIIVDDPVELPEGAEVDVYLHDRASETARREDLAALERALGRSLEQADGGELIDADEVLAELQTL
jgi:hypothetical protein